MTARGTKCLTPWAHSEAQRSTQSTHAKHPVLRRQPRVLRRYVADESVDLVYLDPPFNSNASYNVLFKEKTGEESCLSRRRSRLGRMVVVHNGWSPRTC